uniref:Uncharacterized protein n=1 Tax=Sphaerodactylus townsendi TaxID=933632 RepID=A0ACB8EJ72_9SAUR
MYNFLLSEEVCTLVITEAFPEDSGLFRCVAENEFGAVASSAYLFVFPGTEEGLKTTPVSVPTIMNITYAPKSNYWSNAAGPANQAEHTNSWWQNYGDESKDFCGMYENPSKNSSYW